MTLLWIDRLPAPEREVVGSSRAAKEANNQDRADSLLYEDPVPHTVTKIVACQ